MLTTLCAFYGKHNVHSAWAFSPCRAPNISMTRGQHHPSWSYFNSVQAATSAIPLPGRTSWPGRYLCLGIPNPLTTRYATSSTDSDNLTKQQYFLLKSEPSEYSITDLKQDVREEWDGIRNYQARNNLRSMNVGDRAFFYHSKTSRPGIVGTMRIVRTAQSDPTAYDPKSKYYDKKSTKDVCRWDSVLVEYEQTFPVVLSLKELKKEASNDPDGDIACMALLKQTRLSVVPLSIEQWTSVMRMIEEKISDGDSLRLDT